MSRYGSCMDIIIVASHPLLLQISKKRRCSAPKSINASQTTKTPTAIVRIQEVAVGVLSLPVGGVQLPGCLTVGETGACACYCGGQTESRWIWHMTLDVVRSD